jgi:fructose-bisphosphate aldolase class I
VHEVADATVTVLLRRVPAAVAGIAFLSGGQGDEEATEHLNEINLIGHARRAPWPLTFSYGRALQHAALTTWLGNEANLKAARAALTHRLHMNSLASLGRYTAESEKERELVAAG